MNVYWTVAFGVIGTGLLIYVGLFIYVLMDDPRFVAEMNEFKRSSHSRISWPEVANMAQLIVMLTMSFIATYQIAFLLLGWMPDDWGGIEEGEWVSTRRSLSVVFCTYAGVGLAVAIGRGLNGRISKATHLY